MKKTILVGAILWTALAVLLWLQHKADTAAEEIAHLKLRTAQVNAEMDRARAALETAARRASDQEQVGMMRKPPTPSNAPPAPAQATPVEAAPAETTAPNNHYWSEDSDMFWVRGEFLPKLDLRPLHLDDQLQWRISDQAAIALALTPAERTTLDQALTNTTRQCRELARSQFTQEIDPTPPDDSAKLWSAKFQVAAFPQEASRLHQELTNTVQAILGAEKAGLLLKFMSRRLETEYDAFGERDRAIVFKYSRTPDNQWALAVTESTRNSPQSTRRCGASSSRSLDPSNIPTYWRHLIELSNWH